MLGSILIFASIGSLAHGDNALGTDVKASIPDINIAVEGKLKVGSGKKIDFKSEQHGIEGTVEITKLQLTGQDYSRENEARLHYEMAGKILISALNFNAPSAIQTSCKEIQLQAVPTLIKDYYRAGAVSMSFVHAADKNLLKISAGGKIYEEKDQQCPTVAAGVREAAVSAISKLAAKAAIEAVQKKFPTQYKYE